MAARTPDPEPIDPGLDDRDAVYCSSVALCNIRCFGPKQTLSLTTADGRAARWTLLLGENGVGKTTVLQALALGSIRDPYELAHYWEYEREERTPPRFGRAIDGRDRSGSITIEMRQNGGRLRHEFRPVDDRFIPWEPLGALVEAFICGYGASRRLGGGRLRRAREGRSTVANLFVDVPLIDAEEWLLQSDYAAARNQKDRELRREYDRVRELLLRVLPEADDLRLNASTREGSPGVEVKTSYGWVTIRELSLGYQTLLAWMVDLASRFFRRFPESPDPFGEPAIVLVDEIDLHLHPTWQRQLIGYLTRRFPRTQFIATAHSPLIVQAAGGANVVLLRREDDHVVIDAQPDEVASWRIDQILTSDLFGLPTARPPRLDALMIERRKILTKGKLTERDKKRLRSLEHDIGVLPGGESPDELRATELLLRAANEIQAKGKGSRK